LTAITKQLGLPHAHGFYSDSIFMQDKFEDFWHKSYKIGSNDSVYNKTVLRLKMRERNGERHRQKCRGGKRKTGECGTGGKRGTECYGTPKMQ